VAEGVLEEALCVVWFVVNVLFLFARLLRFVKCLA